MGLVINFPVKYEDRFHVALRDRNSRTRNVWKVEDVGEEVNDEDSQGLNLYIELHNKEYNQFFHWLDDVQHIMEISFKFRYVSDKREAYTGYDSNSMYRHKWLTLK